MPAPCTATWTRAAARRRWMASVKAASACWPPATWRRAASTSPTSATSSISTCRGRRDDYVHRIGRTGRAGKEGRSLTLVTPEDGKQLKDIEKMLGEPITWIGEAPNADDLASGKRRRGRGGRGAPAERSGSREGRGGGRFGRNGAPRRPDRASEPRHAEWREACGGGRAATRARRLRGPPSSRAPHVRRRASISGNVRNAARNRANAMARDSRARNVPARSSPHNLARRTSHAATHRISGRNGPSANATSSATMIAHRRRSASAITCRRS